MWLRHSGILRPSISRIWRGFSSRDGRCTPPRAGSRARCRGSAGASRCRLKKACFPPGTWLQRANCGVCYAQNITGCSACTPRLPRTSRGWRCCRPARTCQPLAVSEGMPSIGFLPGLRPVSDRLTAVYPARCPSAILSRIAIRFPYNTTVSISNAIPK